MRVNGLLLSFMTVVLLVLSFPPFGYSFLIWVSLIPFFYLLDHVKSVNDRIVYTFLTGLFFYLCTLYWLANVTLLGFVLLCFILTFYFVVFLRFYEILVKGFPSLTLISIPALWVALEFIRAHLFSGFPWLFLGHSQFLSTPLIQICSLMGNFVISFFIVAVNRCIYELVFSMHKKKIVSRLVSCVLIFILVGSSLLWGYLRIHEYDRKESSRESVTISLVQGNVSQLQKWDPVFKDDIIHKYIRMTLEVSEKKPDLILWPEAAVPAYIRHDREVKKEIADMVEYIGIPLVTGDPDAVEIDKETMAFYNSAFLISKNGLIMDKYDKIKLVPFGEFIPKILRRLMPFLSSITGGEEDFRHGKEYTLFFINSVPFAVTICFEAIFPDFVRKFTTKGARFIVNLTNDAWFGKTGQPIQDMGLNIFSAVCNGIPFVRCTNTGVSCFIDAVGRVTSVLTNKTGEMLFVEGTLTDSISLKDNQTLYQKTGDIFSLTCLVFVILLLLRYRKKMKKLR